MKLAIFIPAYNCEGTIGDTLVSLQNISLGWESVEQVVVCDDASSDGTVAAVESINFDRCPLTLTRHSSNRGEAACYKTMLDVISKSVNWFLILHSDDIALSCFLTRNLEILRQCDGRVAAVSSNYYVFGPAEDHLAHSPAEDRIVFRGGAESDIMHTALVGTWWHISGSLIRKDLWERFGGRDPALPQLGDWDLMLRWQSAGYSIGHSLIPTTRYRIGQIGAISSQSYVNFRDIQERARVILGYPEIFSGRIKRRLAKQLGIGAFRRVCKLLARGEVRLALRGSATGVECVYALLRG